MLLPDEPTDEERLEELPNDYETPFRPADDVSTVKPVDDTHPQTDSNVDPGEQYQEGVPAASGSAQSVSNPVTDPEAIDEDVDIDDESLGSPS